MASSKKKKPGADPAAKKTVLYVGWSSAAADRLHPTFRGAAWQAVRLDPDASLKPDVVGHVLDMKAIATGSMDAVWCPHILQRFFLPDIDRALRECYRALKEEGMFATTVPNGQLAGLYLAHNKPSEGLYRSPSGPITALDLLYGHGKSLAEGKLHLAHRSAFTAESLGLKMRDAGFTNITVEQRQFEIHGVGYKFGYDHPSRVERIIFSSKELPEKLPEKPPLPKNTAVTPASGPVRKPGKLSDDLDAPPRLWKPLGLNK